MGRFDKQLESGFEQWAKKQGLGGRMTRIRSEAHKMRIMHGHGFPKSALLELCRKVIDTHERAIIRIRTGKGEKGDSIRERKQAITNMADAIDELNGLPDDPE